MSNTIDEWMNVASGDGWQWYVKYLAGNDTLLTKAHQAGPYIPKALAFDVFPSIAIGADIARAKVKALIDSHAEEREPTMIWYKSKNECHFTGWGGKQSKLLDPDNTGALTVFAFYRKEGKDAELCRIWIARDLDEEEAILARVGPVEPGRGIIFQAGINPPKDHHAEDEPKDSSCALSEDEIPKDWLYRWPSVTTIVQFATDKLPTSKKNPPDQRLLRRHDCEFEIFLSVERAVYLPRIKEKFETVQLFVNFANTVLQRRKSRHGASLQLHTKAIFDEEQLPYSYNEESEGGKKPDFLFPSGAAYQDRAFPLKKLRMLAVKTTCKDRWRQVLDEAQRLKTKHLLTLQQGVSPKQYAQMKKAGIVLVVPQPIHKTFQEELRPELLTLEQFIASTKATCAK
jgi:EcoRII C terminal/Restriction endonuclease EcoRII, N-terminal